MRAVASVSASLALAVMIVVAPPARAWNSAPGLAARPVVVAPAPVVVPVVVPDVVPVVAPSPVHPPPVAARAVAPPVVVAASSAAPPRTFPALKPPTMSHYLQFGIALLPGTGYRAVFPYQENVDCGQPGKRVCTGRLPFFLDVQPSFGFANHWDLLVDLRFGLGQDFTSSHEFAVAPGVRYWVDPQEHTKFFATVQVAYDTTAQHDATIRNNDVALRNSNGFMVEIMRNLGAYVQFGETIGFVRWLRFEIDGGLGVQVRLP